MHCVCYAAREVTHCCDLIGGEILVALRDQLRGPGRKGGGVGAPSGVAGQDGLVEGGQDLERVVDRAPVRLHHREIGQRGISE